MPVVLSAGSGAPTSNDGAASVLGVMLRIARLDSLGRIVQGANNAIITKAWTKIDFTPEMDSGVDTAQKNADGTLGVVWRTPDLQKRMTMSVTVVSPDPATAELLSGAMVLSSSGAGIPAPTVTATPSSSGGILAAGSQSAVFTAMNYRGESLPATAVVTTTTGSTGSIGYSIPATPGAQAFGWYRGIIIGSATVYRLAQIIPAASSGATTFTDDGSVTPAVIAQSPPVIDTTAGTGIEGMAYPDLLVDNVGPGCSVEAWSRATVAGSVPPNGPPFFHWVFPQCRFWTTAARALDTGAVANTYSGFGFKNPNWGTGPDGYWGGDSSRAAFYRREARYPTPAQGYISTPCPGF